LGLYKRGGEGGRRSEEREGKKKPHQVDLVKKENSGEGGT